MKEYKEDQLELELVIIKHKTNQDKINELFEGLQKIEEHVNGKISKRTTRTNSENE